MTEKNKDSGVLVFLPCHKEAHDGKKEAGVHDFQNANRFHRPIPAMKKPCPQAAWDKSEKRPSCSEKSG
ncbi:uncharacterized protein FW1_contig-02-210 [Bacillus sp. FW1]|nr:uncharacterized protein FW1_contig-02-210 [Bacillus sp. FW1]